MKNTIILLLLAVLSAGCSKTKEKLPILGNPIADGSRISYPKIQFFLY